jgi:lactoylglutathione lyase
MKIEHIAMWVDDLEKMKEFYETYFEAQAGEKYVNSKKGYAFYFLTICSDTGIKIMKKLLMTNEITFMDHETLRINHISISIGSCN